MSVCGSAFLTIFFIFSDDLHVFYQWLKFELPIRCFVFKVQNDDLPTGPYFFTKVHKLEHHVGSKFYYNLNGPNR